jgi:MoaA/NifB/PqqE/SkfB family radical SAM enzyme
MHERLTGSHNKFAAALNGLLHLKGQDIYVRLKTVLMPGNLDQIHGVLDSAMNEGVDEVHLAHCLGGQLTSDRVD